MPTYRSIRISLHSQFDVETLPEYYPLPQEYYNARGIAGTVPNLVDDASSTCNVYIPVLPGSTFWVGYSISPPVPDGHYFLFKLYINGAHVVGWSTGKEEDWRGKTMFALYERSENEDGKQKIEKRVLRFVSPNGEGADDGDDVFDEKMCMEIRVHRAHGRKRIERQLGTYNATQSRNASNGIDLVNAGRSSAEQPKRFYKFALIDPVDQPFATFKYYYRTWDQLQYLGVLEDNETGEAADDDMPVIEPYEDDVDEEDDNNMVSSLASAIDAKDQMCESGDDVGDAARLATRSGTSMSGRQPATSPTSGYFWPRP